MRRMAFLGLWVFLCSLTACFADEQALVEKIAQLEKRVRALEAGLTEQGAEVKSLASFRQGKPLAHIIGEEIEIGAGATFVLQGIHNANNNGSDREDTADISYSIDLEVEKGFGEDGKAFIHLEAGGGAGVEDELQVFSNVNRDADNDENLRLTEAWYEHYLSGAPLTVTFGKIDAARFIDTNEYANDESAQFLGRIFRNSPVIEFADNGAGMRFGFEPNGAIGADLVLMDADSGWEDAFDNLFLAGQFNFKPGLFARDGNYRILAWLNDRNHTKWSDASKDKEEDYGFGLSFDQELINNVGAFIRYGWQNPGQRLNGLGNDFSLEHSWSAGLQFKGSLWGRENDSLGAAFGQVIPSGDYKNAGTNLNAEKEGHLELYYSCKVNDHLTLSPDLQVIRNPYGKDSAVGDDTIVVGGLRGQVDF